jgi:MoaA/NifB/PqqE/SkfB family radical SAM enzyme
MKPRELRLLIMHVSTRCDQTCAHCSIWKSNGGSRDSLGREERLALLREARSLGARGVLFTGGEPLLCDHIESLARAAAGLGLSVQIATNGLGLERAASWLDAVDEVYVSVEGPEAVHDSIRGASMFSRLQASLRAVRALQRRPRLIGRSVISGRNAALLDQTVAAARTLGLDGISFLGADVTSEAFGGDPSARRFLRPTAAEVAAMLRAISRLEPTGDLGGFVMVEADGALRPCFFQKAVSRVGGGVPLSAGRDAAAYRAALGDLGVGNAICGGCVCPKHVPFGVSRVAQRVRAVVGRALATPSRRSGVSA